MSGRPRKWETEQERRNAQNERRKAERKSQATTHFVAVDGEGQGRGRDHKYVLLGVGDYDYIANSGGLSWDAIATHLYGCYKKSPAGSAFIGFYLGYDFTQWMRNLPYDRARMLFTDEGIS